MQVSINGQPRELSDASTVADMLAVLGIAGRVAVEVNREVVPRARHAQTALNAGDAVEVVTLVGGG
jgi:sulfur carrier protein